MDRVEQEKIGHVGVTGEDWGYKLRRGLRGGGQPAVGRGSILQLDLEDFQLEQFVQKGQDRFVAVLILSRIALGQRLEQLLTGGTGFQSPPDFGCSLHQAVIGSALQVDKDDFIVDQFVDGFARIDAQDLKGCHTVTFPIIFSVDLARHSTSQGKAILDTGHVEGLRAVRGSRAPMTRTYPECCPMGERADFFLCAIASEPEALAAWARWRQSHTIENCDHSFYRVLPSVFRHLPDSGLEPADRAKLKGVYRYHWTRNQMLIQSATSALRALHEAGVETLALRGLALAHEVYADVGLRPMRDADVLVKPHQLGQAVAVLQACGWRGTIPADLRSQSGCEFWNEKNHQLNLCWFASPERRWENADVSLWERSRALSIAGAPTRSLHPADGLLQVCLHAVKCTPGLAGASAGGWALDAVRLVERLSSEDWQMVLSGAREQGLVLTLELALTYLSDLLRCPVPPAVIAELRRMPVSWSERLNFQIKAQPVPPGWLFLAGPYLDYLRTTRPSQVWKPWEFATFLRKRWRLRRWSELPGRLLRKCLHLIRKAFPR